MNRSQVQKIIRTIGLRPHRAAGQHFLLDESVCDVMTEVSGIGPDDHVLEIGPGLGVLTRHLLDSGATVVAVELDRRLFTYLKQEFRGVSNLHLVQGDIFRTRIDQLFRDREYKIVANLPYSSTSLVFRNFLTYPPRPKQLTVMIQKEVAERIVAEPGRMNMLGLSVQALAEPTFVQTVPRTSFWPVPEVTSAVIDVHLNETEPDSVTQRVFQLARIAFSGKRKMLLNSLTTQPEISKDEALKNIERAGLNPRSRPQDLSLENWRRLAKAFV